MTVKVVTTVNGLSAAKSGAQKPQSNKKKSFFIINLVKNV